MNKRELKQTRKIATKAMKEKRQLEFQKQIKIRPTTEKTYYHPSVEEMNQIAETIRQLRAKY